MHPTIKKSLLLIEKCLSFPLVAKLLFLINIGALLFALLMEYGFDVRPCILCLWQRIPYAAAAALSLIALVWTPYRRQTAILLALCSLLYLTGSGIAVYHSGVERHWWEGTPSCAAEELQGASPEELRKALLALEEPRCDEITWSIIGLSLTNLNVCAFLGLALFAGMAALAQAQRERKTFPFLRFIGKKFL